MPSFELLRKECNEFHAEHPEVWSLFEAEALVAHDAGRHHFGVATIWERIRWEVHIVRTQEWAMPNNHRAFYSRRFNLMHPETDCNCGSGFFRIAEQRSKRT